MISNSYFPVLAAAELGFFSQEGLDVSLELMSPADRAYAALAGGEVDFVAAEAHAALAIFPHWRGVKLICAQAEGMYWFLVMRADLAPRRGDVSVVRGRRIGAAPWVELGLRRLLIASGIDPARDQVAIAPIPGSLGLKVNTGVTAAQALEDGIIDGFWANGMGAEIAVRRGVGTIVLDIRRGDGPPGSFNYTFASLAASDRLIQAAPDTVAAAIRAIVATHRALRKNVSLAAVVGARSFPKEQAQLIETLVARDLPFYASSISNEAVRGLNQFARDVGLLAGAPAYADVVAAQFRDLWRNGDRGPPAPHPQPAALSAREPL
jgi:ABC-type nitrate/sulfonate/bicarbonate transport system substrate-binding protein